MGGCGGWSRAEGALGAERVGAVVVAAGQGSTGGGRVGGCGGWSQTDGTG